MESRALDDKQHEKLKRLLHSRLGQKLIESSSGDRWGLRRWSSRKKMKINIH